MVGDAGWVICAWFDDHPDCSTLCSIMTARMVILEVLDCVSQLQEEKKEHYLGDMT